MTNAEYYAAAERLLQQAFDPSLSAGDRMVAADAVCDCMAALVKRVTPPPPGLPPAALPSL